MLSVWAFALVLPAVLIAALDWRKGLYAMLIVAFLQDPARKLEPDQPVYFTLLVGAVFAAAYLRAQVGTPFARAQIGGWKQFVGTPVNILLMLLAFQAANSIWRYGNPIMAGIGALSYLAPMPAVLTGYHFAVKGGVAGIQRWLAWYLLGALIILPSIIVQFAGVEWVTLGQVGEGFEMYTETAILTAHSGFFRAAETAAWHTATAVCLLLLVSSMRRLSPRQIVAAVAVVVVLLVIGALTGRRKIFVEIAVFMTVYLSLLLRFGKGGFKLSAAVFIAGLLIYAVVIWSTVDESSDLAAIDAGRFQDYAGRTATVRHDVTDRFVGMGLEPVRWAIDGFGWLGGGLGVASQGAQHFGGGGEVFGGAGEGGPGKITAELGVPGLLIALWLGVAAVRYGWQVLVFVSGRSAVVARLAYGLTAFLIANLAVFLVATQVYGDLFVLLILGLVTGFFLATPVLAEREWAQHAAARSPTPSSSRPPIMNGSRIARPARRP